MDAKTKRLLRKLASRYETASFMEGDPSKFMHLPSGKEDKEAAAFIASALSFGSRAQFLPKIEYIMNLARNRPDRWVRSGEFKKTFKADDEKCFYRFFTYGDMNAFFSTYRSIMKDHGTLGSFVKSLCSGDALEAVGAICSKFSHERPSHVIPAKRSSACKRICMFLRWMTRTSSPVDIGLWSDFIDKKSLIVPLDTHVLSEAEKLGLVRGKTSSMSTALKLTAALAEAFPDDPVRGDFALFGSGIDRR